MPRNANVVKIDDDYNRSDEDGWFHEFRYERTAPAEYTIKRIETPISCEWSSFTAYDETRRYLSSLADVFRKGCEAYPSISMNADIMAGAPCFSGTRIPIYVVLDTIASHGTFESALEAYPKLTFQQIKDAVGFAKLVVECSLEHETPTAV